MRPHVQRMLHDRGCALSSNCGSFRGLGQLSYSLCRSFYCPQMNNVCRMYLQVLDGKAKNIFFKKGKKERKRKDTEAPVFGWFYAPSFVVKNSSIDFKFSMEKKSQSCLCARVYIQNERGCEFSKCVRMCVSEQFQPRECVTLAVWQQDQLRLLYESRHGSTSPLHARLCLLRGALLGPACKDSLTRSHRLDLYAKGKKIRSSRDGRATVVQ